MVQAESSTELFITRSFSRIFFLPSLHAWCTGERPASFCMLTTTRSASIRALAMTTLSARSMMWWSGVFPSNKFTAHTWLTTLSAIFIIKHHNKLVPYKTNVSLHTVPLFYVCKCTCVWKDHNPVNTQNISWPESWHWHGYQETMANKMSFTSELYFRPLQACLTHKKFCLDKTRYQFWVVHIVK